MLDRYQKILNDEIKPYFIQAKEKRIEYDLKDKTFNELMEIHNDLLKNGVPPHRLKNQITSRIMEDCILCERRCGVNRKEGEKGYCNVLESKISSEFMHFGEERQLVPSHTIFFNRCNFGCVFCQNYDISQRDGGGSVEPKKLASIIHKKGGRNVNWVGGDPTPNLDYIIEVLSYVDEPIPQIWNSNMYLTKEAMNILAKLMDVYLTDFKYGNDECAEELSNVNNYTKIIKRNHKIAERTGDLIIRHLVLPGHIKCCTEPILEWIDNNLEDPMVNIMEQYRPAYHAGKYPKIDRYLNSEEKRRIRELKDEYSHLIG
ncbi:MAG: radical SAM protein [Thermoplasmatota archaeon]